VSLSASQDWLCSTEFVSAIYYLTLVRSFHIILTELYPGLQYAETASKYRGKLYIIIRNPYSYIRTRTDVSLLIQFQYAHLYVKAKMVFIPNNIPYLKIIFALCELYSTTSCIFKTVVTGSSVTHLTLFFNDTCTNENYFLWFYSVSRQMCKLITFRQESVMFIPLLQAAQLTGPIQRGSRSTKNFLLPVWRSYFSNDKHWNTVFH
jgi:hypothetical protein